MKNWLPSITLLVIFSFSYADLSQAQPITTVRYTTHSNDEYRINRRVNALYRNADRFSEALYFGDMRQARRIKNRLLLDFGDEIWRTRNELRRERRRVDRQLQNRRRNQPARSKRTVHRKGRINRDYLIFLERKLDRQIDLRDDFRFARLNNSRRSHRMNNRAMNQFLATLDN